MKPAIISSGDRWLSFANNRSLYPLRWMHFPAAFMTISSTYWNNSFKVPSLLKSVYYSFERQLLLRLFKRHCLSQMHCRGRGNSRNSSWFEENHSRDKRFGSKNRITSTEADNTASQILHWRRIISHAGLVQYAALSKSSWWGEVCSMFGANSREKPKRQ